jgi:hypothetical protein
MAVRFSALYAGRALLPERSVTDPNFVVSIIRKTYIIRLLY